MKQSRPLVSSAACLCLLSFATTANAELHSRLGGAAAYDDVLNITWVTDAGLSGNNDWVSQLAWVGGLNGASYLGFSDWRLASMSRAAGVPTGTTTTPVDCSVAIEYVCRDNELSYMFYYNLGGAFNTDLTGDHTIGDVTLTNVQPVYWSSTEFAQFSAWILHFDSGFGVWSPKGGNRYAWAVRAGDVTPQIDDTDGDGIDDATDNCLLAANPDQNDSNGDGIGNLCDADLQGDCLVDFVDLGLFKAVFFTGDPDADLNGDGSVDFVDLGIMKSQFFGQPGPSALPNACGP